MSGHTPGPWILTEPDGEVGHVSSSPDAFGDIATTWLNNYRANARLIAAAPDMLAALTDMLAGWRYIRAQYGDLSGVGWDRAQAAAEAAIARVESKP